MSMKWSHSTDRRLGTPPRVLEVRDDVAGSGAPAGRLDLESDISPGVRSAYQVGLEASCRDAAANHAAQSLFDVSLIDRGLAGLKCLKSVCEARLAKVHDEVAEAVDGMVRIRSPRRLAKIPAATLVGLTVPLGVMEYPLAKLWLVRLPMSDTAITLLAILLSVALLVSAHVLALSVARLVQAEGDHIEGRRDWSLHRLITILGTGLFAVVLFSLAWVRASEVHGVEQEFLGQGLSHPVWFALTLGVLHALVLLVAFYLSYLWAKGREWREADAQLRKLRDEEKAAQAELDKADSEIAGLRVERQALIDRTELELQQLIEHHRVEESKYLAILNRQLENPPMPIEWDLALPTWPPAPSA